MRFKSLLYFLVVAATTIFVIATLFPNLKEIKAVDWKINIVSVSLVLLALIPIHFLNVLSWHLITKSTGLKVTYLQNLRIWIFSSLSRFLPGSVWQYVGRSYLTSKETNSSVMQSSATVLLEIVFNLFTGLMLIGTMLYIRNDLINLPKFASLVLLAAPPFLLMVILFNQGLLSLIAQIINRLFKRNIETSDFVFNKNYTPIICAVYFLQYIFAGLTVFFISNLVQSLSFQLIPSFVAIFASSWILGYISLFAPGGLGVQEISMAGLISKFVPLHIGVLVAIIFRLSLVASELLIALTSLSIQKRNQAN